MESDAVLPPTQTIYHFIRLKLLFLFQTHILASFPDRTDVQATVKSNWMVDAIPDLIRGRRLAENERFPSSFKLFIIKLYSVF
jgi:hypothetical protein